MKLNLTQVLCGLFVVALTTLALPATAAPAAASSTTAKEATSDAPDRKEMREERRERMRERGEHIKKELGLTEAQDQQIKAENERYHTAMKALRDEHKTKMDAILTPEQRAKAEQMRADARARRGMDDEDEDDDDDAPPPPKKKGKRKG